MNFPARIVTYRQKIFIIKKMTVPRFSLPLIILFFLFPYLLAANDILTDSFEETPGRGLVINTNPNGVKVFIDGVERGSTPLNLKNVLTGVYQIRLQKEGYRERNLSVVLNDTRSLIVSIKITEILGTVIVTIKGDEEQSPPEPQLIYASTLEDKTLRAYSLTGNKTALRLPAGYRTIKARAFGWEDESVTVLVDENKTAEAEIKMKKASFIMKNISADRRRFNPLNYGNLGVTEFRYEVSAPGEGRFNVIDSGGSSVYTSGFKQFDTWIQKETWNGRDSSGNPVPEGIYAILIEADGMSGETDSLRINIEINYLTGIFPLSMESGFSGLIFTPMPNALPAGSYQFGAGLLFGNFLIQNTNNETIKTFGFPFKFNMRISPVKNLELTAFFNINPFYDYKTRVGISGSVKYSIVNGEKIPLSFAAGGSYAWANENGSYPLSPGKGVGLFTPLSFNYKRFSAVFCPAAFWRGPEKAVPELQLCAGAHYRAGTLNAGLSYRFEIDFENEKTAENAKHLTGAELHINLKNFVISLNSGLWTRSGLISGFGGVGIGMIF